VSAAADPAHFERWRWLGLLGILLYVVHAAHLIARGEAGDLLWACLLGSLIVGFGMLLRLPVLNAVGFLWVAVGVVVWILYLAGGGELLATSFLPHVGGVLLGYVGIRKLGLPRQVWWKAGVLLALVHLLSRFTTPEQANVNLAFSIHPGWEPYFPSHVVYVLCVFVFYVACFVAVEFGLRRSGLVRVAGP
jgi:hypothetical protein